jgi:uncharacterized protein
MSVYEIGMLIMIGLIAGIIGGTMGVGGGVVIIPALVMIFGFTQQLAQGTSLLVLLFPGTLFAVINYYKNGYVNVKYALIITAALVVGSLFGSLIAVRLPVSVLKKVFGVYLLLMAAKLIFSK